MAEKEIIITTFDPVEIIGQNEININAFRHHFPKLKIVVRGEMVKLIGDDNEISSFEKAFIQIINYYKQYEIINPEIITEIISSGAESAYTSVSNGDILVHGRSGILIKARTPNQKKIVESCNNNNLIFAIGPAGSGKTYTAVAIAVKALKNKEVKRIILTRPAVEAGENLGFLPGDLKDKLDPYLQPLYDALWDMIPSQKLSSFLEDRIIEIAPLAFMRGRTLDNAYVILDEAQNATTGQMKMFLTRMGKNAKFIVTGDITQIDLPKNQPSGLINAMKILNNIDGIDFIMLDNNDIIRHKLVSKIINAYNDKND